MGHAIDSGPTVFTLRHVFDDLFAAAGESFDEHVRLGKAGILARHSWVGSEPLDLHADVDRSVADIERLAGRRDAESYRAFAAETASVFETLDRTFMRAPRPNPFSLTMAAAPYGARRLLETAPFKTLWRSLDNRFDDPRLRQLFSRYATYCGSNPFEAPATLALIAHAERLGVWLLEGGMQALADALLSVATRLGCDCRFGTQVTEITTQGNRASGVLLANGAHVNAEAVVFNGDTNALADGLLGAPAIRATGARRERSLSAVTCCRVARPSGFDLAHHNVFFCDDYPAEFEAIFRRAVVPREPTVYLCAQDRPGLDAAGSGNGSGHENGNENGDENGNENGNGRSNDSGDGSRAATGAEPLFCLINAPARDLSATEIDEASAALDAMLGRHGLRIDDDISTPVVTTPNDFARRFPGSKGALYGRPTHGWFGSFRRPGSRSRVPGLYLAGGSVHPGAGVPMASLSGQLAADCLLADVRGRA